MISIEDIDAFTDDNKPIATRTVVTSTIEEKWWSRALPPEFRRMMPFHLSFKKVETHRTVHFYT